MTKLSLILLSLFVPCRKMNLRTLILVYSSSIVYTTMENPYFRGDCESKVVFQNYCYSLILIVLRFRLFQSVEKTPRGAPEEYD